jgi:hypothetical protein
MIVIVPFIVLSHKSCIPMAKLKVAAWVNIPDKMLLSQARPRPGGNGSLATIDHVHAGRPL